MIIHVWCNCNNQQPEEIKRGVIICNNCHNDVNPSDIEDFSTCEDLVPNDNEAYEAQRVEDVTQDYYYR